MYLACLRGLEIYGGVIDKLSGHFPGRLVPLGVITRVAP
jgi:hypothetical protein